MLAALRPDPHDAYQGLKEKRGNPKTRFSCHIRTRERVFDGVDFPMADVRAIRERVPDVTVNDVALAVAGGALRRYLEFYNELPEDPLVVMQPVSAHEEGDDIDSGSRISVMFPNVHTEIADPWERIELIHASTKRVKKTTEKVGAGNVADIADILPTNLIGAGLKMFMKLGAADHIHMGFSGVSISNVPFSRGDSYLAGARLIKIFAVPWLIDGMGLLIGASSYGKWFSLQFISTPDMMPDPEFFTQCLQESFDELRA